MSSLLVYLWHKLCGVSVTALSYHSATPPNYCTVRTVHQTRNSLMADMSGWVSGRGTHNGLNK